MIHLMRLLAAFYPAFPGKETGGEETDIPRDRIRLRRRAIVKFENIERNEEWPRSFTKSMVLLQRPSKHSLCGHEIMAGDREDIKDDTTGAGRGSYAYFPLKHLWNWILAAVKVYVHESIDQNAGRVL